MITTLRLKNFRQHEDTLIEFVPGINTIVGLNNSGKSTLPEAIEFALFGSRALRDTAKGYIRDGTVEGSAVVGLTLGDSKFVVGRNSKNAEVRKDGVLDARYKDNVSSYMAHVTGVNQTGFRLGHYVRQKELAAFSSLRPGKRYETIERMLKINAVDKAIKALKAQLSTKETEHKILLAQYKEVEQLQDVLDDLLIAHSSLDEKEKSLRKDLATVAFLLTEQHEQLLLLQKKPTLQRVREDLLRCNSADIAVIDLTVQLADLVIEDYDSLKARLEEVRQTDAIRKEIEGLNPIKPEVIDEPEQPSEAEVITLRALQVQANKKVKAFKLLKADGVCPTCHQTISSETFSSILTDLEAACEVGLAAAEKEYQQAFSQYKERQSKYAIYVKKEQTYTADALRLEELTAAYAKTVIDPDDRAALEQKIIILHQARETRARLLERKQNQLKIAARRPSLEQELQKLCYLDKVEDNPELAGLIRENAKVEKDLNIRLNSAIESKAHTTSRILEQRNQIEIMLKIREDIESGSNVIADKKAMQEGFVLFKRHLTSKIRPLLEQVASTLFHKTTKDRYATYTLSNDYEITLKTHLGFARKLTSISGSENDLACLCLRLAIATLRSAKLAGSLGFIILDEISGSFDDERTKQTLEGLLELRDVIPQIINITHKPVEMKFADKLFTVKESNGTAHVIE